MGLLNKSTKHDDEANEGALAAPLGKLVDSLLDVAIEGRGPIKPVKQVAAAMRRGAGEQTAAITKASSAQLVGAAVGGFVTSVGGFAAMPVALPLNIAEFYFQATRVVAKIAELRGYDVDDAQVRQAISLALAGADADEVFAKVGMGASNNFVMGALEDQLPDSAMMMVNKAVAFRLMRSMGEKSLSRLGKGIPVVGGFVGAGLDTYLMFRIIETAKEQFPQK